MSASQHIADLLWHAQGFTSTPRFKLVLELSHSVNESYVPPNRNALSGPLLGSNYEQYEARTLSELHDEADLYCLSLFADRATLHNY